MSESIYKNRFDLSELSVNEQKWMKHYQKLCNRGQERASTRKESMEITNQSVVEDHHVYPECMGGTKDRNNMVFLTPSEHFVAHQLLAKIYPKNSSFIRACLFMCTDQYGYRVNNKMYGWLRKELSKRTKGIPNPKVSIALKGRNMTNDESMRIRAEAARGRPNPKLSVALSGRNQKNFLYLMRLSIKRENENFENCSRIQKFVGTMTGRNKSNTDYCIGISETLTILTIDERKELVKLKDQGIQLKIIHRMFLDREIKIAYTTLSNTYRRVKKDMISTNIYD